MIRTLRAPGLPRAGLWLLIGIAFSWLVLFVAHGFDAGAVDGESILRVAMLAAPLFALVGLGAFDYWFYWASGRPTRPEDHSGHGAYSWKDYFRINTDHKVIGIQYTVHSFVYLLMAACSPCSCAPSSRSPAGSSSTRTRTTACSASTRRS